jgi:conjugal transfer mating pair stabilization protein TraG
MIAQAESKGNYNAYYGNADNTTINFTAMSVGEVLAWQKQYVENGSPSSAVGKYQFVRPTLEGLVNSLNINKNAPFNEALQDKLAIALLEKRGVSKYAQGEITREQFAHNLSKEWAGLPKATGDNAQQSYYAGDGLNKARISIDELYTGIASIHPQE